VDWGIVLSGAITGVVGLAGIVGTAGQGKRSREAQTADLRASLDATAGNLKLGIDAENARARQAEKRRVYAKYLAALSETLRTTAMVDSMGTENVAAVSAQLDASTALIAAMSEVELIAPQEVRLWASAAHKASEDYDPDPPHPFNYGTVRVNLILAMRDDLGEPPREGDQGG
jgi:hypothetical protein